MRNIENKQEVTNTKCHFTEGLDGNLEFRTLRQKKLFQAVLYKYSDTHLMIPGNLIKLIAYKQGFKVSDEEVESTQIALCKMFKEHIYNPQRLMFRLGGVWSSIIITIWTSEMELDDDQDDGLHILATLLRAQEYIRRRERDILV